MNISSFFGTLIIGSPSHTREAYQTMAISGSYDVFVSSLLVRSSFGACQEPGRVGARRPFDQSSVLIRGSQMISQR